MDEDDGLERINFGSETVIMDMYTLEGPSKRQKICQGDGEDRITHLPDNILHYILSLLPTKYAVVTSALSTRWKYLWKSIYSFDFCDDKFYTDSKSKNYSKRKNLFRDFVGRILLLTGVSNINKFILKCRVCDAAYFNKWISIVTKRKVEELVVSITHNPSSMVLNWIFSCESLRILKIHIDSNINIPALVCFSSLKILHLESINFFSDQEVQKISLIFPNLEELVIAYCRWLEIKTVNIVVPTLRMLTIEEQCRDDLCDCEIKVDAERLVSLRFKSYFKYKYSLCHLSSLVDASIDVSPKSETVRVGSFLKDISNVRDLQLSVPSIEMLANPAVSADVCSLSRLSHLRVLSSALYCVSGRAFMDLLCLMPKLESLVFPFGSDSFIFKGRILGTTPQCFLSHLKIVDIGRFRGIQREIRFVKFWMKSVTVMGNLTINLGRCSEKSEGWKEQITRQLDITKHPNCILQFCESVHEVLWWT